MFEAYEKAAIKNRYQIQWLDLSGMQFNIQVALWLDQLDSSRLFSGPSRTDRKALTLEFRDLLQIYVQMARSVALPARSSPEIQRAQANLESFKRMVREKFKEDLPLIPAPRLSPTLQQLVDDFGAITAKRDLLVEKKELILYWLRGVRGFNPHLEGEELVHWQYMGNAAPSKVRLFLNVLVRDADRLVSIKDPRPLLKAKGSAGFGFEGEKKLTITREDFEWALKAEASASYGLRASGECSLEFTGLKAQLKAEALVGASVEASGEMNLNLRRGIELKGSVEAEIGIKIKAEAKIDVAEIFLVEASAEAFAGAMAKAEVEVTARIDGVKFKLAGTAFAGARVKGQASMTMKICGYEVLKGEVSAYALAGIGVEGLLEFEASVFGGAKLAIGGSVTYGVGTGVETAWTVYPTNLPRIAHSIFYTAYLTIQGEKTKKYVWRTYFRDLEDNEKMFMQANEIIDRALIECYMDYMKLFQTHQRFQQLQVLSLFRSGVSPTTSPTGVIKIGV